MQVSLGFTGLAAVVSISRFLATLGLLLVFECFVAFEPIFLGAVASFLIGLTSLRMAGSFGSSFLFVSRIYQLICGFTISNIMGTCSLGLYSFAFYQISTISSRQS